MDHTFRSPLRWRNLVRGCAGPLLFGVLASGSSPVTPANAQDAAIPATTAAPTASVSLSSKVEVERAVPQPDGSYKTVLVDPKTVSIVPGDTLEFTLSYHNQAAAPATGFRAVNPMPAVVRFVSVVEDWAEVSVDGGKTWGQLASLRVKSADAAGGEVERAASAGDVTHVRWVFAQPIPPGSVGKLTFRGVVK